MCSLAYLVLTGAIQSSMRVGKLLIFVHLPSTLSFLSILLFASFLKASSDSSGDPRNERVCSLVHLALTGAIQSSLRVGKLLIFVHLPSTLSFLSILLLAIFLKASSDSSGDPRNERVCSLVHLALTGAIQSSLRVGKSFSRRD